jgi:hypothetical protein
MTDIRERTDNDTALRLIEEAFAEEKCRSAHQDATPDGYPCLVTPVARMWFCAGNEYRPVCLNMIRYRDALVAAALPYDFDGYTCDVCGRSIEECWTIAPL